MKDWKNQRQSKWASFILPIVTMILWFWENSAITAFLMCLLAWVLIMVFTS